MEIEVGEYVRTRAGHFYKVTKIDKNGLVYWNKIQCGWSIEQLKDIAVKHSKNIIDLIEVGDYVNGYRILEKTKIKNGEMQICILKDNNISNWRTINDKTLKTIVTHEQFASIEYKV